MSKTRYKIEYIVEQTWIDTETGEVFSNTKNLKKYYSCYSEKQVLYYFRTFIVNGSRSGDKVTITNISIVKPKKKKEIRDYHQIDLFGLWS